MAPIGIGLKRFLSLRHEPEGDDIPAKNGILPVAAAAIANGGDNIGVYTPLFATQEPPQIALTLAVFAAMTALWCWLGRWLVERRTLGRRSGAGALGFCPLC